MDCLVQSGDFLQRRAVEAVRTARTDTESRRQQGHYLFTCTGMEQCHSYRPILFNGKDYEPVNRKAYNKIHERYYADPVGFIMGNTPNVRITIRDNQGNEARKPKNIAHNPLELD